MLLELHQLLQRYGPLDIRKYAGSSLDQESVGSVRMRIDDFVRTIVSGEAEESDMYLANHDHAAACPADFHAFQSVCRRISSLQELEDLLRLDEKASCRKSPDEPLGIWFGPGGHREQLHYDAYDNIHVCIVGRKVWRLFPPTLSNFWACSPLPIFRSVNATFAKHTADESIMRGAHGEMSITLRAGDAIWVPAYWWHEVTGATSEHLCSDLNTISGTILHRSVLSINHFRGNVAPARGLASAWQRLRLQLHDAGGPR